MISLLSQHWIKAGADLLTAAGCLSSIVIAGRSENERFWIPAYVGLWINANAVILLTGGGKSHFLDTYMVLLFVSTLVVQTRFAFLPVAIFCLGNMAAWTALTWGFGFPAQTTMNLSPASTVTVFLLTTIGVFICLAVLMRRERALVRLGFKQQEQLNETEDQLMHAAKLAEMGNLVATIAHEIAQPVTALTNASTVLRRAIESGQSGDQLLSLVALVNRSADRATRLSRRLKDFARTASFERKIVDLRQVAVSALELTEHVFVTRRIQLVRNLPDAPIWVSADAVGIEQVLLNLLNNARDAAMSSKQPRVEIRLTFLHGWARISVSNTGGSIPPEIQKKLFDPYFTTKAKGEGTGLGLSICERIVQKHEGRIFFSSEPENTLFCVDLPCPAAGASHHSGAAERTELAN